MFWECPLRLQNDWRSFDMTQGGPEFKQGARGQNDYCASQGLEADANVMRADTYAHKEHARGCAKYRSQLMDFWRTRGWQASMSGQRRGELRRLKDRFRGGYNGVGESPYPLLWGGRPSVQEGSRAESLQPKYRKSEKSGRNTMVNCSCK